MVMLSIEQKSQVDKYYLTTGSSSQHRESLSFFNCQHAPCAKKTILRLNQQFVRDGSVLNKSKGRCGWKSSKRTTDTIRKVECIIASCSSKCTRVKPDLSPLGFIYWGGGSWRTKFTVTVRWTLKTRKRLSHSWHRRSRPTHVHNVQQWDGKARQPLHAPKGWPLGAALWHSTYVSRLKSEDDSGIKLNCSWMFWIHSLLCMTYYI